MEDPRSRFAHFSAVVGKDHYVFGGFTEGFVERKSELSENLHVLKEGKQTWETKATTGERPPALYHGFCTSLGHHIYVYGGHDSTSYHDSMYQMDTTSMKWCRLPSGPMKKTAGGFVAYEDKLALFAGSGYPSGPAQPGAEFIEHHRVNGLYYSNEVHLFNLTEGKEKCTFCGSCSCTTCAWPFLSCFSLLPLCKVQCM